MLGQTTINEYCHLYSAAGKLIAFTVAFHRRLLHPAGCCINGIIMLLGIQVDLTFKASLRPVKALGGN